MSPTGLFGVGVVVGVMVGASLAWVGAIPANYLGGVDLRAGLGLGVLVDCDGYGNGADDGLGEISASKEDRG